MQSVLKDFDEEDKYNSYDNSSFINGAYPDPTALGYA